MSVFISPRLQSISLVKATARFRRDERGSLTILALCLFLLMIMMGGLAVDLLRYETTRTELQNTLDRCTLMAASMRQSLNPQSVVTDCVAKAGLSTSLDQVAVVDGLNNREVTAKATQDTRPFFLHLLGIDSFDAKAASGAQQGITNVEIAMVLDVSGSMDGNKIANLKTAAKEFVDTMLTGDTDHRVSISMVPYSGQVNLGPQLAAKFNTTDNPNVTNMNCIDLPAAVYNTTSMSTTLPMPMTGNVDTFSYYSNYMNGSMPTGYASPANTWTQPVPNNRWCLPKADNVVVPMNNSVAALQGKIDLLSAGGATSINAGIKWGLTLLDPATRPIISQLAAQGAVSNTLVGRPYDYTDPNTMKVIIVMTDGEHFPEERLNTGFRSGSSPIYRAPSGEYSIFRADRAAAGLPAYWVPSLGTWQNQFYTGPNAAPLTSVTHLKWPEVWAAMNAPYVAWQFYARAAVSTGGNAIAAFDAAMSQFRTLTPAATMNSQLQQICSKARDNKVIVYGIAFEASANGQAQIQQCAHEPSNYFNAQGLSIQTAFRTIASNLTQLKLTQ